MKTNTITFAIAAAAFTMAPALSAAETEQRTTGVTYSDLDLSSEEGVAELDRRIDRAAQQVCSLGEHELGTRVRSREARQCYQQAKRQLDRHFAAIKRDAQKGG